MKLIPSLIWNRHYSNRKGLFKTEKLTFWIFTSLLKSFPKYKSIFGLRKSPYPLHPLRPIPIFWWPQDEIMAWSWSSGVASLAPKLDRGSNNFGKNFLWKIFLTQNSFFFFWDSLMPGIFSLVNSDPIKSKMFQKCHLRSYVPLVLYSLSKRHHQFVENRCWCESDIFWEEGIEKRPHLLYFDRWHFDPE